MKIVNLSNDQIHRVFPDISFVTFRSLPDTDYTIGNQSFTDWMAYRVKFSKDLKKFLRDSDISFAWPNSASVDFSQSIVVAIINSEDYSMVKLMAKGLDIFRTYMIPSQMNSFMFYISDQDYEKYKDAISEVKR